MGKSQTYKAFVAHPSYVLDLNGELLDSSTVLAQLASEVQGISGYATFVVRNDMRLGSELVQVGAIQPAVAGRRAGVTMPRFFVEDEDGKPIAGKSGRSRKEALIQHNVVTSYRS